MPCTKCENGKYKWGKTGECKYDSKEACEKSNKKKYNKMKPTPLGKKTYEEYEKELKEFNLSKVERIDLSLVSDMNKSREDVSSLTQTTNKFWIEVSEDTAKEYLDLTDLWDKWREISKKANSYTAKTKNLEKSEKAVTSFVKALETETTKLIGYIRQSKEAAKELGVDVRDMNGYGEAVDIADNTIKTINKIEKDTVTARSIKAMKEMIKEITS